MINHFPVEEKPASKGRVLLVAGYSMSMAALLAFLTINGANGTPLAATLGTAVLLAIGLLLPAAGMLLMTRSRAAIKSAARILAFLCRRLVWSVYFLDLYLLSPCLQLSGYLIGAVFVVTAAVSAIAGTLLLQGHYLSASASNAGGVVWLIFGTALIFGGAGTVAASNIAFWYLISQVENTIYVDMGATISACGCCLQHIRTSFFIILTYQRK